MLGHWYPTSADAIMPMTDHFLTFILQPVWMAVCHCDRRFLFSCTLQFCDSWRLGSKMLRYSSIWKTARLFVLLFLLHYLFTFVVCLCQCNTLIISSSLTLLPSLLSLCLFLFCLCLSLSLPSVFPSGIHQRLCPGPKQHFCSSGYLRSKVQRPAWGELASHTNKATNTQTDTHSIRVRVLNSAGSRWCNRCQTYSAPSTSSHVFMLLLPLVSSSWTRLRHHLNVWFLCCLLLHTWPMSVPFHHTNCGYLSSPLWECIVCFICPPLLLLLALTLLWWSVLASGLANFTTWTKGHVIFLFLNFEITLNMAF